MGLFPALTRLPQNLINVFPDILDKADLSNRDKKLLWQKIKGENLNVKTNLKKDKPGVKKDPILKSFSGLRSRAAIEASGAYERLAPAPISNKKNGEEEKRKLQHFMAYGTDYIRPKLAVKKENRVVKFAVIEDEFEIIMAEIMERKEFLDQIKESENYKEYEAKMNSEISQRLIELEKIDKNQNEELQILKSDFKNKTQRKHCFSNLIQRK